MKVTVIPVVFGAPETRKETKDNGEQTKNRNYRDHNIKLLLRYFKEFLEPEKTFFHSDFREKSLITTGVKNWQKRKEKKLFLD